MLEFCVNFCFGVAIHIMYPGHQLFELATLIYTLAVGTLVST